MGFRIEMAAQRLILSYWKHIVAVVVLVVLGFGAYGWSQERAIANQRSFAGEIARAEHEGYRQILADLPEDEREQVRQAAPTLEAYLLIAELNPMLSIDEEDARVIGETAAKVQAVGDDARGAARAEAYLKAAELYRIAGNAEGRRGALEAASKVTEERDVLHFLAESSLADMDMDAGDAEAAITRLRALMDRFDGFLGQQAAMDLARALESLQREEEAQQVYATFLERWPDAPKALQARERLTELKGEG